MLSSIPFSKTCDCGHFNRTVFFLLSLSSPYQLQTNFNHSVLFSYMLQCFMFLFLSCYDVLFKFWESLSIATLLTPLREYVKSGVLTQIFPYRRLYRVRKFIVKRQYGRSFTNSVLDKGYFESKTKETAIDFMWYFLPICRKCMKNWIKRNKNMMGWCWRRKLNLNMRKLQKFPISLFTHIKIYTNFVKHFFH